MGANPRLTLDPATGGRVLGVILMIGGAFSGLTAASMGAGVLMLATCGCSLLLGALFYRAWRRVGLVAGLVGVHVGFVIIAIGNYAMDCEPFSYTNYYVIGFVWAGLFCPRWTSLKLIPGASLAYLLPLTFSDHPLADHLMLMYSLPCWVAIGEILGWVVRRLREAQLELQASEARTRAIIEHAAEAIITVDSEGRIEVFNPAASRIFACSSDAIIGHSLVTLLASDYTVRFDVLGIEDRSSGTPIALGTSAEIRGRRRNGEVFPIYIALSVVTLAGKPLLTAIVQDISERRRAEAEKHELHKQLMTASRQAGMAEIAANVLHNVGNVLNSVKTSSMLISRSLETTRMGSVTKVAELIRSHREDLGRFLTEDPRGKLVPDYVAQLGDCLEQERHAMRDEARLLSSHVEHIEEIIRTQQTYAQNDVDVRELVLVDDLVADALRLCDARSGGASETIALHRELEPALALHLDRHKAVQILVNLIHNARQAIGDRGGGGTIRIRAASDAHHGIRIDVVDDGIGIAPTELTQLFNQQSASRSGRYAAGLHGAALFAQEMGGALSAHSDGVGTGARFSLNLPAETFAPAPP